MKNEDLTVVMFTEPGRNNLSIFSDTCYCCGYHPYYLYTDRRLYVYNKRLNQLYYRNKRGKHYVEFTKSIETINNNERIIQIKIKAAYKKDSNIIACVDKKYFSISVGTILVDDSHGYCHPNKVVLNPIQPEMDVFERDLYDTVEPIKIRLDGRELSYSKRFNELILV